MFVDAVPELAAVEMPVEMTEASCSADDEPASDGGEAESPDADARSGNAVQPAA
jgi:hypothetical protein